MVFDRASLRGWSVSAVVALALWASACGTPAPTACNPACREGFTCVAGACVSACNPGCSASERCDSTGGRARCVAATDGAVQDSGTDTGSVPSPDAEGPDASVVPDGSAMDAEVPDATTMGGDSAMTSDSAMGMDGAARDSAASSDAAGDAAVACGSAGQRCCERYCSPGLVCEVLTGAMTGTCVAPTRSMGECSSSSDCSGTTPRCRVGLSCGDHPCHLCGAAPMPGTVAFGGTCANSEECASGFCFGGFCSTLCAPGSAGDARCGAMRAGSICSGVSTTVTVTMPPPNRTSTLTYGACRPGCTLASDCVGATVCAPTLNYPQDRLDFICRTPSAGLLAGGAVCTTGSQCSSSVCVGFGGSGRCFQGCRVNTDCPASAPSCLDISWFRPLGGAQPGRACGPVGG
ncbi:MAG: hypothetical protein Q8Q09_24745 [Deltaproteobacteria bacterium]|nr:hypothetical protein [Deltaproteobacteria bacterium]